MNLNNVNISEGIVKHAVSVLSYEDIYRLTLASVKQQKVYVEIPKNSDLSKIKSLDFENFTRDYHKKGIYKPNNMNYIIGSGSILPLKLNNCTIEDNCSTQGMCSISNSVVYGTLYDGSYNTYKSGTLKIKNSSVSQVVSFGGGVVVMNGSCASFIEARVLKLEDSTVGYCFVDTLAQGGVSIVLNAQVNNSVSIVNKHNVLGGDINVLGGEKGAFELHDDSNNVNDFNYIVNGNLDSSDVGFLQEGVRSTKHDRYSAHTMSVYNNNINVKTPCNVYEALNSRIEQLKFSNLVNYLPIKKLKGVESFNSNDLDDNNMLKPVQSKKISASVKHGHLVSH